MELHPVEEAFILHWGDMGSRWGVSRSMAQIHALLFLADRPLTAEELGETLHIARSNVSICLKELQNWGLIETARLLGDRRHFFKTDSDPWELARVIARGRKNRELDPTLTVLRQCVEEARSKEGLPPGKQRKIEDTLEFLETLDSLFEEVIALPKSKLQLFARLIPRTRRTIDRLFRRQQNPEN